MNLRPLLFSLGITVMLPLWWLAGANRNSWRERGVLLILLSVPLIYPFFTTSLETLLFATVLTWMLAWIAFIDIQEQLIADYHTLLVGLWGLFSHIVLLGTWKVSLIGLALATAFMMALKLVAWALFRKKYAEYDNGFGDGDVLLVIALGAAFGPQVVGVYMLAALSCIAYTLPLVIFKRRRVDEPIPFVPFIYVGAVTTLLLTM